MNKLRLSLCALLLVLCLSTPFPSAAVTSEEIAVGSPMRLTYIASLRSNLDINSGQASYSFYCRATGNYPISVKLSLQKMSNIGWLPVVSHNYSGSGSLSSSQSYPLTSSGRYRALATASCMGETVTAYSVERVY